MDASAVFLRERAPAAAMTDSSLHPADPNVYIGVRAVHRRRMHVSDHASTRPPPVRPRPSPRRRLLLKVALSIAAAAVLLLALEGVLRLVGFGGYPHTFRRVGTLADGSTLMVTDNPGPASYFFANRSRPGTLHQCTLVMPKPKGVFRVMLAGESAMKGFPQPKALSSASFLEAMLGDVWPERKVEIVNLGTTAVASYPVLGMLTESLDYEPDLCVIYVGNNEFFGAYGVASLHSVGRSPSAIRMLRGLRSLAIAQCLDSLMAGSDATADKTLMEAMMGRTSIAPDDPIRKDAARILGVFVGQMIDRCRKRGVPVVVCTLPDNERDLAPLGKFDAPSLSETDRKKRDALIAAGDPASIDAAVKLDPTSATARYKFAQAQLAAGDLKEAQGSFQLAIDLDPMPWRPPSESQDALRRAAQEHGAALCDLQGAFRAADGGPVGWDLMDDHVHPSLKGQDLVARTIVKTLTTLQGPCAVKPESYAALPPFEQYAERLGANEYDRYGVAHQMRVLASISFFKETNPLFLTRCETTCRGIIAAQPRPVQEIMTEWQKKEYHVGEQRPITGMVGRVLVQLQDYAKAERCFDAASRSVSLYSSWNIEFTYFMLICRERTRGRLDPADLETALAAIRRGELLLGQGRSVTGQAERYVGRLHQLRQEFDQAIPFLITAREKLTGTDLVANDLALVESYIKTNNAEKARAVIQDGIDHSGQYAEMYRRMLPMLGPQKP